MQTIAAIYTLEGDADYTGRLGVGRRRTPSKRSSVADAARRSRQSAGIAARKTARSLAAEDGPRRMTTASDQYAPERNLPALVPGFLVRRLYTAIDIPPMSRPCRRPLKVLIGRSSGHTRGANSTRRLLSRSSIRCPRLRSGPRELAIAGPYTTCADRFAGTSVPTRRGSRCSMDLSKAASVHYTSRATTPCVLAARPRPRLYIPGTLVVDGVAVVVE